MPPGGCGGRRSQGGAPRPLTRSTYAIHDGSTEPFFGYLLAVNILDLCCITFAKEAEKGLRILGKIAAFANALELVAPDTFVSPIYRRSPSELYFVRMIDNPDSCSGRIMTVLHARTFRRLSRRVPSYPDPSCNRLEYLQALQHLPSIRPVPCPCSPPRSIRGPLLFDRL